MIKSKGILFLLLFCMILTTYSVVLAGSGGNNSGGGGNIANPIILEAPEQAQQGESFDIVFSLQRDGATLKSGSFILVIPEGFDANEIAFANGFTAEGDSEITFAADGEGISIDEETVLFTLPLTVKEDAELGEVVFFFNEIVFNIDEDKRIELGDLPVTVDIVAVEPTLSGTIKTYGTLNSTNGISAKLINTETEHEEALELTIVDDEVIITPIFVDDLADGGYKLTVSGAGFISYEKTFELDNENGHSFNITTFYPGDVYDTTNKINFYDFHALCSYLDGASYRPVAEENLKYDLNRDGKIDKNDINNLTESYKAIVKGGSK